MPNWSTNYIAIKDKKDKVLAFVNSGLINSGAEPETDIQVAVDKLNEVATHKTAIKPSNDDWSVKKEITSEKGLTLRTFLPTPDTFLEYDTTNYKDKFKEIAEMQEKKYGAIGWYDYNCKTLGTKWDSDLEGFRITNIENDVVVLEFYCDTAWSLPDAWLGTMKDKFNIHIFVCAQEESNAYNIIAEIGGEEYEDLSDFDSMEGCPQRENYPEGDDGDDEYWEAMNEFMSEALETQTERFDEIVCEYEV